MCSNDMDNDGNGAEDMVNHPSHYTWLKEKCGIEVIDITRHLDFDIGNDVKYLLMAGIRKTGHYQRMKRLSRTWRRQSSISMIR